MGFNVLKRLYIHERLLLCLSRVICPRSRYIHRCQPRAPCMQADACQEDSFCVFRSVASADRDTSIRFSRYTYKSLIISLVDLIIGMLHCMYGLPSYLNTMQSMLNAAARSVFRMRRFDRVTAALVDLHWLRVPERERFEVTTLVYRCLRGLGLNLNI
jgi:hypothetical protein